MKPVYSSQLTAIFANFWSHKIHKWPKGSNPEGLNRAQPGCANLKNIDDLDRLDTCQSRKHDLRLGYCLLEVQMIFT